MYRYFIGRVEEVLATSIVLEVSNIGYEIFMGELDIQKLRGQVGEVKIYTYTHIREDAFLLFGFINKCDLDVFNKLIDVNGIGSKTAVSIIGNLGAENLITALENNDIQALTKCQGIGKKTAQRMILELKGKLVVEEGSGINIPTSNTNIDEAVEALGVLGFQKADINLALKKIEGLEELVTDEIIKIALKQL